MLAKNFTGETGTVEKKLVDIWPFCEGVVDNIGNPTGHPAYDRECYHIPSSVETVIAKPTISLKPCVTL